MLDMKLIVGKDKNDKLLDPWQSRDLIKNLLNTQSGNVQHSKVQLGFPIAYSWVQGNISLHIHARVTSRSEAKTGDLCWVFSRQLNISKFPFDRLTIGDPVDLVLHEDCVDERHLHQKSSVLVDIGQISKVSERIALWLRAVKRLRLLNDCPCVSADRYTREWVTFIPALRRRYTFISKLLHGVTDWEAVGLMGFLIFPKDQLPDEMIQCSSEIIQAVSGDQSKPWRQERSWTNRDDKPRIIIPECDWCRLGVLLIEHQEFTFNQVKVFVGPPEFGPRTSQISDAHFNAPRIEDV